MNALLEGLMPDISERDDFGCRESLPDPDRCRGHNTSCYPSPGIR